MRNLWVVLVAVGLLLFTTGCPSFSTLRTAEPVEQGETEMGISTGYLGMAAQVAAVDEDGEEVDGGTAAIEVPTFEILGRHGLTEDLDAGIKVYPVGAAFEANYAFINDDSFSLSVNPYLGFTRIGGAAENGSASVTYGFALANLLADVVKIDVLSVTLGLKPGMFYAVGAGESQFAAVIGGMGGVNFDLTDNFSVMPSFDILFPIQEIGQGYFYNVSLAFMF